MLQQLVVAVQTAAQGWMRSYRWREAKSAARKLKCDPWPAHKCVSLNVILPTELILERLQSASNGLSDLPSHTGEGICR